MLFQCGVGQGLELGKQGRILRGRDGGGSAGDRFGRERARAFPLVQIAPHSGTLDTEAAGHSGFGVARLDSCEDTLAEISRIWFHTAMILLRQPLCQSL